MPSLVDDKPDVVIIHVGTNGILCNASYEDIALNIIKIGSNCKSCGVNDVFILSVLVKKNPTLNAVIRRLKNMFGDFCVINEFGFICNHMIATKYLWKDGIHLQELRTSILTKISLNL